MNSCKISDNFDEEVKPLTHVRYPKKKKYIIDYAYWSNEIPKACSTKVTALATMTYGFIWRYRMIRPVNKKNILQTLLDSFFPKKKKKRCQAVVPSAGKQRVNRKLHQLVTYGHTQKKKKE